MDWSAYKARCDCPEVWSRWLIEQWLQLLAGTGLAEYAPTAQSLLHTLSGEALPKPADHRGGPATDMFEVTLSVAQAQSLLDLLDTQPELVIATPAQRFRGLGGFREAMVEYLTWRRRQPA